MSPSCAQKQTDLSAVKFDETPDLLLQGLSNVQTGKLFDRPDMLSYGFDNNGSFLFRQYKPPHIELLSFNDKIAGYGFRVMSYEGQQGIEPYLKKRYPALTLADSSRWGNEYLYADDRVSIRFFTITEQGFKEGRCSYLHITTRAFAEKFESLDKKFKAQHDH